VNRNKTFNFEHGGDLEAAARGAGCEPERILDFSNLLNPQGPPPGLAGHLAKKTGDFLRHPSSGKSLREHISEKTKVPQDQILLGAGTTEFIHLLPRALRPRRPLILGPTYGDYEPTLREFGAEPVLLMALDEEGWVFPGYEWDQALSKNPDFVVLARPNNPPFAAWPKDRLLKSMATHSETFFVVDETCLEISENPGDSLAGPRMPSNLAVLRSFSKAYAAPGLRLGWMAAPSSLAGLLRKAQEPWTVSPFALEAGLYLMGLDSWVTETSVKNKKEKERVFAQLSGLKNRVVFPSPIPAFTVKGIEPGFSADVLLSRLLTDERLLIRSLGRHPGLGSSYFRVGLRSPAQNDILITALKKYV
jgi:histidinol-phosphate/aromatic aminotransferase/cobyric acid decarboxylase-like protein